MTKEVCYRCGMDAAGPKGVICVRRKVGARWKSVPICYVHWNEEMPDLKMDDQGKRVG